MSNDSLVHVRLKLKNVGALSGHEVIQLYISDNQASVRRPKKELKAFTKVYLNPGETRDVEMTIDKYSVSFFDEETNSWKAESGKFKVLISSSAKASDVKLIGELLLEETCTFNQVH
ncbi:hypothetical protein HK096_003245 [Nowakowskiella sp. JEL0078]|nr:hypothetical protein HK096_003245 [Nowakowskiella sp. JEL0078]